MRYTVIRFSSLGDCILLCSFLSYLKLTGAEEVTVVTRSLYKDLFMVTPGVDRVIALGNKPGLRNMHKLASSLRHEDFTLVDAHNNLRSRMLSRFLGKGGVRLKKYYTERNLLILFKKKAALPSMKERYAFLADQLGLPPRAGAKEPEVVLSIPESISNAVSSQIIDNRRRYVAIAPGARWPMKKWGYDNYAELARRITAKHNYKIIILGDEDDMATGNALSAELGESAINITGTTRILEAAAILKQSEALICNDSGLMHLAEAVGTPVLALFGPTVEAFGYYPSLPRSKSCERAVFCRPCSRNGSRRCHFGTQECLTMISVDAVEEVFRDLINGEGPRRYVLP